MKKYGMVNSIKSSRQIEQEQTSEFLTTDVMDEMIVKRQKNSFRGVRFYVGRLMCIEERIAGEMIGESTFDHLLGEFGQKRQIGDGAVI